MYLISIAFPPEIYGWFFPLRVLCFFFVFFSILAFTKCRIKEDEDNEKNFHPNETKNSMIFKQLDLVKDSTTSYFVGVSRGS